MSAFAARTGLTSEKPQERYLWTDAFAVSTLLELERVTGGGGWQDLALRLVDRVHHTLGRHRPDDARAGWISGLGEQEGEAHPTAGGLRIGKKLRERGAGEPFDERREWDRDGQYFHYLTKWMRALDQVSRATRQPLFNAWARELARAAHAGFVRERAGPRPTMSWKMSIDLSRPLVASMGHHDPLDGFVTCLELRDTASRLPGSPAEPGLTRELASYRALLAGRSWTTADPLGLGGLLMDAALVAQVGERGADREGGLLSELLMAAVEGLRLYVEERDFAQPAGRRLAFRELGLAIGLPAVEVLEGLIRKDPGRVAGSERVGTVLKALRPYLSLGASLVSFWREASRHLDPAWTEHRNINEVMLAASLVPEGCLVLPL